MTMASFLFVTWNGAGNQVPEIGVASALGERGHAVTFAGYPDQRDRFARLGFEFRTLDRAQRRWPSTPPADWMPVLVDAVWACREHLDDLDDLLAGGAYDALVVDCLMFGALAAAERHAVPTAVLVHSAPGALLPPGGGLDHLAREGVNDLRADAGLPAVADLWDTWRPFTTLCTSVPELDPLRDRLPAGFAFVGPVAEPARPGSWPWPWRAADERPLVVASFSTGPAWDQVSRIRRTVAAVADGARRLLVTTGPFEVPELAGHPDVVATAHVPHGEVLPWAAATVTHAGHGTVAASLAHGVPVVALPNPAADQPALAAQVARLGAGVALDGEAATPGEIAAAVDAVLTDEHHIAAARRVAAAIAARPGAPGAVERLERLASADAL
jgi:UDP:flavonoid glycosyltransferase YjiC (YdhE family)